MPIRKFAKIVESAMRDADQARRIKGDAGWNKVQQKDRGATLRKFETVQDTIRERDVKAKKKTKKG